MTSDLPTAVAGLDANEVNDGLVIYDEPNDRVHYLNHTAAVIFTLADGTRSSEDLAGALAVAFGLPEPPLAETVACIEQLRTEGLLAAPMTRRAGASMTPRAGAPATLRFQLAPLAVEVGVDDAAAAAKLEYLACEPVAAMAPRQHVRYDVRATGEGYEITEAGVAARSVRTPDDVLFVLFERATLRAHELLAADGWVLLHSALAGIDGRRFLVTGPKGAGKSTLTARLLFDGHAVEGDESVLVRDGEVFAFPRRFHLKPGTEVVVPELAAFLAGLPHTATDDGTVIRALDPAVTGRPWRLAVGRPHAVFLLAPERADEPAIRPLTTTECVQRLVHEAVVPNGRPGRELVRACVRLADGLLCAEVTAGPPGATTLLIGDVLRALDR